MSRDPTGGMDALAEQSAAATDAALSAREARLLLSTSVDLKQLRPNVSDKQAFDQLIAAVKEATARNESIGQFQARIEALGEGVVALARKVVTFI